MKVSDQMQKRPVTATPETPVGDIAKAMVTAGVRHVVVVDGDDTLLGIITATDLIARHARLHFPTYFSLLGFSFPLEGRREQHEIEQALATTAGELMTTNLITVPPDSDVDDAAQLMLDNEVACLPVVVDGQVVGTIDETDIVRLLVIEESN